MNRINSKTKSLTIICILAMLFWGIAGMYVTNVDVKANDKVILTSSEVSILGFQMKANLTDDASGISFRAVGKVPKIGSTVTASGKQYVVKEAGIIYVLDPDNSGVQKNKKMDDTYTILDSSTITEPGKYCIGFKRYNGQLRTYGYVITPNAILDVTEQNDTTHMYYAVTMTKMDKDIANTLLVRAFVIATDGTVIYGEDTKVTSVAKIAYQLYTQNMAGDAQTHSYLYHKILNSKSLENIYHQNSNPFYLTKEVEYGWGGLYLPK